MQEEEKGELKRIFAERVAFHQIERMLYSSDLGDLPGIVKTQIATNPDAVVQPNSSGELAALLDIAAKYSTPLVPRGSGTAGYGGAVPTRGGIVVDFYRMNKIIDIDKEKRIAIVEPGVVWNDLEAGLHRHGLALRLYPGSAPSATVAGWIANGGGVGIGSFEYGYIKDNIVELEIITPKGPKRIAGDDLDLVDGMAGTTGFISQVTLMLRDKEDDIPVVAAFPGLESCVSAFEKIKENKLSLWEVGYKGPSHVRLTHEAVANQAKRGPIPSELTEPKLPEDKVIATFVYPKSRDSEVRDKLLSIIEAQGGEVLDEAVARFEWEERFYPIRLKALGPSLVPSEVVIPTQRLPMLVENIEKKIKTLAFNGTLVAGGSQTTVMTYALDDERRRGFPLAYSTSFVVIKAARKLGGRRYSIGMYFTDDAELLLGKDNLLKIYQFKEEVDPGHILNPGKVFPTWLEKGSPIKKLNLMIKLASSQTGAMAVADKLFGGKPLGEFIDQKTVLGKLPFGKEVAWDAFACTGCGYCRNECTEFGAVGWESASPRGKFHFLREYLKGKVKLDERMAEMFFVCTTCRRCNLTCQVGSHIDEHWTLTLRPTIWQEGFNPPLVFQTQAYQILANRNPGGFPQSERKEWIPPTLKHREEGEIGYWAGCSSSFSIATRNIAVNAVRILNKAEIEPACLGAEEWCCGGAMYVIGCLDEVMELVEHNIKEINKRGIKTLITSCPGCWLVLAHFYPLFAQRLNLEYDVNVKHMTEIMSELLEEGRIQCKSPLKFKVTYHDPCHIGRGGGILEPPRKIFASIPGLEFVEMPRSGEQSACCGRHVMRYPKLGMTVNGSRITEAEQTGAAALVSACPTCETNLRIGVTETGAKLEVLDISDLVAASMGLPTLAVSKLTRLKHGNE